ncbi:MAG: B12-binding domain-containing radical SAM protein [Candidatus Rifleibacteriota bacterium]
MGLKHRYNYESLTAELRKSENWYITPQYAGKINLAVIYPNLYSLGMSNLGFLTVHRIASSIPGIGVERFFPALQTEKPLEHPFYSFETNRPLGDFDILLFSFSYEGDFDKIPGIFSALGIPVKAEKRNKYHPLLIAGGAAVASNAKAMEKIFDVIVPWEAETTLEPVLTTFLEKELKPEYVADLPGVWVPAVKNTINPVAQYCNINLKPAWSHIVSNKNAFGGAHILEVMRGCPRICKFCLARVIYKPVRTLRFEQFRKWLDQFPDCKDLGLVAPSLFDHPEVEKIFSLLNERNIRIRNSSVKWEKLNKDILEALMRSNVKSLTLAPESGSEKLRADMGKPLNFVRFLDTIKTINDYGFENIKLYFVAGLPGEKKEDVDATINFIDKIKCSCTSASLSVAFSFFVPKKNTPWQNEKSATLIEIKQKIRYIKEALKNGATKSTFVSPHEVYRQIQLSHIGSELAEQYAREAEECRLNRLFSRNQFSALEF